MQFERIGLGLDRIAIGVWLAMLLLGLATWLSSGLPAAGAAVVIAVVLSMASPTGALYATCAAIPLVSGIPSTIGAGSSRQVLAMTAAVYWRRSSRVAFWPPLRFRRHWSRLASVAA